MSDFIDILLMRVPHALHVVLRIAFYFSLLAIFLPRLTPRVFHATESFLTRLAERKTLAVVALFFIVIGVRLALLPQLPVPVPGIHDEYSYLLLGDTLAHGRLANPPHPMWISFESFHVNWFPAYGSKYPPAQGAVLALGQLLGHPWIGVLLSVAAMCAAMPRIIRRARTGDALLLSLGIAILANSRPYEGLLLSIPVASWFLWWLAGKTKSPVPARARIVRVLAPLAVVLLLTAGFIGYYNWRLTGNAFLFPYALNTRTYRTTGLFLWDHPKEPLEYHNQPFKDFYNRWERQDYQNTWRDVRKVSAEKLTRSGS